MGAISKLKSYNLAQKLIDEIDTIVFIILMIIVAIFLTNYFSNVMPFIN